jgi:pimeloyl-ACP methyl ester carboxylesterase
MPTTRINPSSNNTRLRLEPHPGVHIGERRGSIWLQIKQKWYNKPTIMSDVRENSHLITIRGLTVHYWESNPHLERTLVMLHGFRSSHQGLMKLAHEFPDHHLIIPDFPGYGLTDELAGEHTVPAYADVIAGLIAALKLTQVTLIGHSFGALVGLAYASEHADRLLNLVMVSPVPKPTLVSRAGGLYYLIGRALPAPLDRHWLTSRRLQRPVREFVMRTNDPVIHAEVMSEGERELEDLRPNINLENYFSLASINPSDWLENLNVPTLIVAGDSDRVTRLSDVVHTYQHPLVTIQVIEGMGHFAPAEIPAEISHTVQAWLTSERKNTTQRKALPLR